MERFINKRNIYVAMTNRDFRTINGINVYRFYYREKLNLDFNQPISFDTESKEKYPENYIDINFDSSVEPMQRLTKRFTLADLVLQLQIPMVFRAIDAKRFRDVIKFGKDRVDESEPDPYHAGTNGFYGDTDLRRVLGYGDFFPKLLLMYREDSVRKREVDVSEDIYDFITSPKSALVGVVVLHDRFQSPHP